MFSLFLLMLMLGVANWFATTLLVESEIFRPLRQWVGHRTEVADAGWRLAFWEKARYMIGCHMCAGTWVALAMALFVPAVVNVPVVGWLLTALVIKGIGHLVLLLNNVGNARIEYDRAAATESMANALPDLESMLGGLMSRHEVRVDAANERNKQGRRNQAGAYMFPDETFTVPKKNKRTFEPLDEDAFTKPETKF